MSVLITVGSCKLGNGHLALNVPRVACNQHAK